MLTAVVTGVVVTLIGAAILAAGRWLRVGANRDELADRAKQAVCDPHEWEPIKKPGDEVVLISADSEWCRKCGKRR